MKKKNRIKLQCSSNENLHELRHESGLCDVFDTFSKFSLLPKNLASSCFFMCKAWFNKLEIERLLLSRRKLGKSGNSRNNSSLLYTCLCFLKVRPSWISQNLFSVRTPTVVFLNVVETHLLNEGLYFRMRDITCKDLYIRLLPPISMEIFNEVICC